MGGDSVASVDGDRGGDPSAAAPWTVVVDVANVMGSRPDGWWKDRVGAAARLLADLSRLSGASVAAPDGAQVGIGALVAVVEGQAKAVGEQGGVSVVRAPADGDSTIVAVAQHRLESGEHILVVTADRGLRARLPDRILVAGPGWLNGLLGR